MIRTSTLAGGSLVISKGSDRPLKTCGEGGKAVPYQDFHSLSRRFHFKNSARTEGDLGDLRGFLHLG